MGHVLGYTNAVDVRREYGRDGFCDTKFSREGLRILLYRAGPPISKSTTMLNEGVAVLVVCTLLK